MKSEMTPPKKPPAVMPMKYQSVTTPMSDICRPHVCMSAGAMKPKFQLSICSQK